MSLPASPEEMGVIRQARLSNWSVGLGIAETFIVVLCEVEDRFGVVFRNMEAGTQSIMGNSALSALCSAALVGPCQGVARFKILQNRKALRRRGGVTFPIRIL